jgi:hypothetical protein
MFLTADDEKKNADMGVSDDDESGSEYDSDDDEMPGLEEKAPEPEPEPIPSIEWKNQGNVHYKVHHTFITNPRLVPASRSGPLSTRKKTLVCPGVLVPGRNSVAPDVVYNSHVP